MTESVIKYEIVAKPFNWGGGRCAKIKADLQKKVQNCMAVIQSNENFTNSKVLRKIEIP